MATKTKLQVVPTTKRKPTVAERVNRPSRLEHLRLGDVIRLMGGSAANGDKNDPVVYTGEVEAQMREVIARYGFERLPLTYGELTGMLDYVDALDTATGMDMFDTEAERKTWQGDFKVWRKHWAHLFPAIPLYAAHDVAGLQALHKAEDTLTQLGKKFDEFNRRR
jgi:hypothetical protein